MPSEVREVVRQRLDGVVVLLVTGREKGPNRWIERLSIPRAVNFTFVVFRTSKTQCWLAKWIGSLCQQGSSQIDAFNQIAVFESSAFGD